ncbi:hypothetical protein EZV62_026867 [Acer yangbiense]|uniref:DUF676 domain-containing protein n=1 Tax=Acer yangbiense TaxID=1000413 RepID=A0A5C7GSF0_9ROSI|nr:hypothetical protein EZV62_026867 [Acer yangbiense]
MDLSRRLDVPCEIEAILFCDTFAGDYACYTFESLFLYFFEYVGWIWAGFNNWKHQGLRAHAMSTTTQGNFASSRGILNGKNEPDHLLVLVHGIMASQSDWTYVEAELKRRLGRNFLIYASSCNSYTKTFTGVDGAGKRLADEVMQVVKKTESLKRISFLAHSLGGLFARYAVAVLYSPTALDSGEPVDLSNSKMADSQTACSSRRGTIAGLEPVNFITLATPHLGVRGRKQLPFLFGVPILEKLAAPIAPILVGRTGSQLFLTDGKPNKPPLLLRMASDCEDRQFLSSLGAFRCRILYANVSYDLSLTSKRYGRLAHVIYKEGDRTSEEDPAQVEHEQVDHDEGINEEGVEQQQQSQRSIALDKPKRERKKPEKYGFDQDEVNYALNVSQGDPTTTQKLKMQLSKEFDMKDLGAAQKILGMQIRRDRVAGKIWLSQAKYIQNILERFNMNEAKPVTTPLAAHYRLSALQCPTTEKELEEMSKVLYASVVGCLMDWVELKEVTLEKVHTEENVSDYLIKSPPRRSLDGYKHVVDVEFCPPISSDGPHFTQEAVKAKEAAQKEPNMQNTLEYHEIMEDEMIRGLQQLGWKKVDVSFHSTFWPFFAHNNIHVKYEWLHNAGTGVVAHVADSLKQQESSSFIAASL